jgi:hypothetical protein
MTEREKPSQCTEEGDWCEAHNHHAGITMMFLFEHSTLNMIIMRTDATEGPNGSKPQAVITIDDDEYGLGSSRWRYDRIFRRFQDDAAHETR